MGNLARRNYEEDVRLMLLRYPNDLHRVAAEVSEKYNCNVTVDQVRRIRKKMKKAMDRDVSLWVATNMSREILQGAMERKAKLEAMYAMWDGKEEVEASLCCNAPVKKIEWAGNEYYRCMKCDSTCGTKVYFALELEKLKLEIVEQLRAESKLLLEFSERMGFTVPREPVPVQNNQNFILVSQQGHPSKKDPIEIEATEAKKLEDMSPAERERYIHQLEEMQDAEFEDEDGQETKQKGSGA